MKLTLKDKIILITGGANGIGKNLVEESAELGAIVIFCDIAIEKGKSLEANQKAKGKNVTFYTCDVSCSKQVAQLFNSVKEKFGKLDILINNAAEQTTAKWDFMTDEEFSSVIDTNLKGVYYCMKYASKIMQNGANITNILSIYHNKPRLDRFHYDAAKGGVAQLTREGALALEEKQISVNAIYPGFVITPMNEDEDPQKAITKNILKSPEIIQSITFAKATLNYIENFSNLTTGQIFGVDGRRSLK